LQTFNYNVIGPNSGGLTNTSGIISYVNIPTMIFTIYGFGNLGFLAEFTKKENRETKNTTNREG
jgi:hypothetical protein